MTLGERIGGRIRELRERRGWTQQELAEAIDVTQANVSRIEAGKQVHGLDRVAQIADALGVSLDSLVSAHDAAARALDLPGIPLELDGIGTEGNIASERVLQLFLETDEGAVVVGGKSAFTYPSRLQVQGAGREWFALGISHDWPGSGDGSILPGDILTFDPARRPKEGDIVVADGRFARNVVRLRRLRGLDGGLWLWPVATNDQADRLAPPWKMVATAVLLLRMFGESDAADTPARRVL